MVAVAAAVNNALAREAASRQSRRNPFRLLGKAMILRMGRERGIVSGIWLICVSSIHFLAHALSAPVIG
jgi:hypothetical protein